MDTKKIQFLLDWVRSVSSQMAMIETRLEEVLQEQLLVDAVYHPTVRKHVTNLREKTKETER